MQCTRGVQPNKSHGGSRMPQVWTLRAETLTDHPHPSIPGWPASRSVKQFRAASVDARWPIHSSTIAGKESSNVRVPGGLPPTRQLLLQHHLLLPPAWMMPWDAPCAIAWRHNVASSGGISLHRVAEWTVSATLQRIRLCGRTMKSRERVEKQCRAAGPVKHIPAPRSVAARHPPSPLFRVKL